MNKDGGPMFGFPSHASRTYDRLGDEVWRLHNGRSMSLLDYYAGEAMHALLCTQSAAVSGSRIVKEAFDLAEAMLKERARRAETDQSQETA